MTEPLIQFRNVHKAFGEKVVYRGLFLEIHKGEVLTIVGGSGVGKSVMLKMLIGLLKPDRGTIKFEGNEVTVMGEEQLSKVRQRIAMLFQAGALFDSISVEENVAYGLEEHFRYKMSKKEIADRVEWALGLVGLPGIQQMWPADLSGGMRKRVALARTMILKPEIMLYDEPTTGLDPVTSREINDLILKVQQIYKTSSIIISHDMSSVFQTSNRIAVLIDGRCSAEGNYDQLTRNTDPAVQGFFQ